MHLFQYNQVLPLAGNDVIVLSPLGGAVSIFHHGFWKSDLDFKFTLHWQFMSILNRLEVIRLYSFGWDFSIWGYFRVVFRGYHSPKLVWHSSNIQKALPCTNPRMLSHQSWKSVQAFRLQTMARIKKERKGKDTIKTHKSVIFHTHVAKAPMMWFSPTLAQWLIGLSL